MFGETLEDMAGQVSYDKRSSVCDASIGETDKTGPRRRAASHGGRRKGFAPGFGAHAFAPRWWRGRPLSCRWGC